MTFDSQWYVRLSEILGTYHFPAEWDFLRTPLFPAMLKFAFWLLGRQVMAVFGLQSCLACAGIWLLSQRLRSVGLSLEAATGVAVLGAFPTLIAYQHLLLTEVGTFFFFSLLVYLLAKPEPASLKGAAWLAFALGAGYYYRASLLYLAPIIGGIYVMDELRKEWRKPGRSLGERFAWRAVPQFLIVAAVPFLLAYPWQRNPKVTERNGHVLLYGLVVQGVLPLHDPILGAAEPVYAKAIEESKTNGVFPNSGLTDGRQWLVIRPIYNDGAIASGIFIRAVLSDPRRYFQGVARNLMMFGGFGNFDYDNALARHVIFTSAASEIDPGPPWIAPLGDEFKRTTAKSFTSSVLQKIAPFYDWMVMFGLLVTVAAFFLGLWRWDQFMLAFTAPTLGFIALHALLLVSQDRMIMPVQPVLLLNLIMLPAWLRSGKNQSPISQKQADIPMVKNEKETLQEEAVASGPARKWNSLGVGISIGLIVGLFAGFGVASLRLGHELPTGTIKDLGVDSAEDIEPDLNGYISNVDGAAISGPGDAGHPIAVPPGPEAVVEGWFEYGAGERGVALDEVFGVVDNRLVIAETVSRPDVSAYFKNAKLANSGYRLRIGERLLGEGSKRIDLIGRTKQNGKLHRFGQPLYLVVR